MVFHEEKGLAVCGLVCALCSVEGCPGCTARGCKNAGECAVYQCAAGKGISGCFQCEAFPCAKELPANMRSRAFNRYARLHGVPALLQRLRLNQENGVVYHRPGTLTGDYDACTSEQEVLELLQNGRLSPYTRCPVYRAGRFVLRLVREEDAAGLLECCAAPTPSTRANAEYCGYGYEPASLADMQAIIRRWLEEYRLRNFVRFTVVDEATGAAAGTVEFMDGKPGRHSILRVDLAAPYETRENIDALLKAADQFFAGFGCETIVTRAVPEATECMAALEQNGYAPCPTGGGWAREGYYLKKRPALQMPALQGP